MQRFSRLRAWFASLPLMGTVMLLAYMPMCSRGGRSFSTPMPSKQPKLVVGIVVDQMRYDYIQRFWHNFGEGGFKRLVNEGTLFQNCNYNYVPTETAPGHASIFTGTTPSRHGIIMNDWIDHATIAAGSRKSHSSVLDSAYPFVGIPKGRSAGGNGASPRLLLAPTLGDALKQATQGQAKVVGLSLKDRSAILPAGKAGDAAYWFDTKTGNMISSTYYPMCKDGLPAWMDSVNALHWPLDYLRDPAGWTTLLPAYRYLAADGTADSTHEGGFSATHGPWFPHQFSIDPVNCCSDFTYTPWGNSFLKEVAKVVVKRHGLGEDNVPDLLSLSFSSTDIVGHQFGIESRELEDTYLRLDRDLEEFLNYLDAQVGRGNVLVFLTADHGGAPNPRVLHDQGEQGGWIDTKGLDALLRKQLGDVPGRDSLLCMVKGHSIYLNRRVVAARGLDLDSLSNLVATTVASHKGILTALTLRQILALPPKSVPGRFLGNGIHPERSGDVFFLAQEGFQPTIFSPSEPWRYCHGTTHGTHFAYDTHVPLIFWGWHVAPSKVKSPAEITQVAATVCDRIGIQPPAMSSGKALKFK